MKWANFGHGLLGSMLGVLDGWIHSGLLDRVKFRLSMIWMERKHIPSTSENIRPVLNPRSVFALSPDFLWQILAEHAVQHGFSIST